MKNLSFILPLIILMTYATLTGCAQQTQPQEKQTNGKMIRTYTQKEAAKHSTVKDCWVILDNKVYDVTSYIETHPGMEAILEGCGIDATTLYETRPMGSGTPHSGKAREDLVEYYIGEIK
jgi:cytochrome b involved in lipid metabolism